jgi:hypothetical protein
VACIDITFPPSFVKIVQTISEVKGENADTYRHHGDHKACFLSLRKETGLIMEEIFHKITSSQEE